MVEPVELDEIGRRGSSPGLRKDPFLLNWEIDNVGEEIGLVDIKKPAVYWRGRFDAEGRTPVLSVVQSPGGIYSPREGWFAGVATIDALPDDPSEQPLAWVYSAEFETHSLSLALMLIKRDLPPTMKLPSDTDSYIKDARTRVKTSITLSAKTDRKW